MSCSIAAKVGICYVASVINVIDEAETLNFKSKNDMSLQLIKKNYINL